MPTDVRVRGSGADLDVSHVGSALRVRSRVLLLNATYEPLAALPVRRAVTLLVCDKADPVHEDPDAEITAFHSVGKTVFIPSVIRLRRFVRVPYRGRVPLTRAALMLRDRGRCGYCGDRAETIDHVIPRSRGGTHAWENCVASCAPCNHRKADRLLSEIGWTLHTPLVPPTGPHWRLLSATTELEPDWLRYLGEGAA
ncbi:MAG: HNH endonuclease [Nocardiaceae bacterium]|nr:HNH endonuclease [Nocardiaceae bacterium]